jgi:hypothetical protein
MLVKLLDSSLIRRYNRSEIEVDSDVGNLLISKRLALRLNDMESKDISKPPMDKMMKYPEVKKEIDDSVIFPNTIISK